MKKLKNERLRILKDKKIIEIAAERLAEIFVSQVEFNKNKNLYEKRR